MQYVFIVCIHSSSAVHGENMNMVRGNVHEYIYDSGMRFGMNEAGVYSLIFHISGR